MIDARTQSAVRAAYGLALLCIPGRMIALLDVPDDAPGAGIVVQLLGARHVAQAALTLGWPTRGVTAVGVVADTLHCATDIGTAAALPRWRRAAAIDAVLAALFACVGAQARQTRDTRAKS